MHEHAVVLEVVEALRRESSRLGRPIASSRLRVGALSGIDPRVLPDQVKALSACAELSRLHLEVELAPVQCACRACGHLFEPPPVAPALAHAFAHDPGRFLLGVSCPSCLGDDLEIRSGTEIEIIEMKPE
jgi:Zn finger protein HypA/HybF involved in hydrogenase expression